MKIDAHAHISIILKEHNNFADVLASLKKEMQINNIGHTILIPDNVNDNPKMPGLMNLIALLRNEKSFSMLGSPNILKEQLRDLDVFHRLFEEKVIKGLKFFPGHDPYYANDARCWPYFELCKKFDAPAVIHTGENISAPERKAFNNPKYVVEIAKKFPGLKIIISHFFWPDYEYCFEATKGVPNIYFDLSGTVDDDEFAGSEKIREPIRKVLSEDPRKVIFGTDWPICDVTRHVRMVELLPIGEDIKQLIFSGNARRVYDLSD